MTDMEPRTLEDLVTSVPNLVDYFYNDTLAPHSRARSGLTPVPLEQSNWAEEQQAWRQGTILFDQSHHMPELFLRGKDAIRLLSYVGVNGFSNFRPSVAKQFVACNYEGQFIGETLIYCHGPEEFELVSGMTLLNWLEYQARIGGYDVQIERDNHTGDNATGKRVKFRFGMDGPTAGSVFAAAAEGDVPPIKFFHTANVRIAGCDVITLRHGMAGHHGFEISGAYEDGPEVREALLNAGRALSIRQGGTLAYFSTVLESGWMGSPFPALYTSERLRDYRRSLPANGWEAKAQLGGSFYSENVEDYYVTPWNLGTAGRIKFDHEFIGREALQRLADTPQRLRRTLIWNDEDVTRILASILQPGPAFRQIRLPYSAYAFQQYDAVRAPGGTLAGLSTLCGYSANEAKMLSLAMLEPLYAELGTELVLIWGEPGGGSRKPQVERHRQTEVRVKVGPTPYAETVRQMKYS
jgi:vanillate/3-O-methylgallate O-demethylase